MRLPQSVLFLVSTVIAAEALGQERDAQINQARQFQTPSTPAQLRTGHSMGEAPTSEPFTFDDDAFGAQQFLKRQEEPRPFTAFAEVSGFYTDNVALTQRAARADAFLVASFGFNYRRPLSDQFALDAVIRGALFRYDEFHVLDFNSIEAGVGVTWAPKGLGGIAFFSRYHFTELISSQSHHGFFHGHTVSIGAQKVFTLSRAHSIAAGAAAQLGFADPAAAQRDELTVYAGYRLQLTRSVEADAAYRYGYFIYREEGDRRDHNQSLSLALRWSPTAWMALSASSFLGFNHSNSEVFDYRVMNLGGGATINLRF